MSTMDDEYVEFVSEFFKLSIYDQEKTISFLIEYVLMDMRERGDSPPTNFPLYNSFEKYLNDEDSSEQDNLDEISE